MVAEGMRGGCERKKGSRRSREGNDSQVPHVSLAGKDISPLLISHIDETGAIHLDDLLSSKQDSISDTTRLRALDKDAIYCMVGMSSKKNTEASR